jgi:phage major head subunit gpT-like protein
LIEPGLRRVFDIAASRPRPMVQEIFGQQSSTKMNEHYEGMGALPKVPVFDGTVPYHDFAAGYKTTIKNYEFALGMVVQRALIDDEMYGVINRRATGLGQTFGNTVEADAADLFINAFTDNGTNRMGASTNGADGVALLSTAHPRSPIDSGTTDSNEGTLDLNVPNVDTARQAMANFTDDVGELLGIEADTVLVPTELERTARQIFGRQAIWEPGSAEFNSNMFAGGMRVVVWNRLTDSNAWFLINTAQMMEHLIFQWRIRPEFARAEDFDGIQAKFRGYQRYGIGWSDWRWIIGENPS